MKIYIFINRRNKYKKYKRNMSNSKTAVQEIKNLMVKFGFITDEVSLQSFKLEDETILQAEKLEAGQKIMKINEQFEQVSLEDGSFKLKENFEIEVKDGSIVSVREIFVEAELEDGTKISIEGEDVAEGAKVVVITAEGSVPAPDGTHSIKGGGKVTTKGGIIESVEMAEVENEEGIDGPATDGSEVKDSPVAMGAEASEIISILKEFVIALEARYAEVKSEVEEVRAELNSFKKSPAGKPVASFKADFNSHNTEENVNSVDARVKALMRLKS
jgi:hypothetical protein